MQFQKIESALSYLDQVRSTFDNQPQVYDEFMDVMREFKSLSIDTPGVVQRVSDLFHGHPELIMGFNAFLPPGHGMEVQPNEQVQVSIPGTNVAGIQGPTSLIIRPTGPPTVTVHPVPQTNHTGSDSLPHASSEAKHPHHQNSPPLFQSGGVSPGSGNSPNSAPSPADLRAEYNHALNFVNKIKNRFRDQPEIYRRFLELLHTYKKEQLNLKEGVNTANKPLTLAEVYLEVANLFKNQEDLIQEFIQFLPHTNGSSLMDPVDLSRL